VLTKVDGSTVKAGMAHHQHWKMQATDVAHCLSVSLSVCLSVRLSV